MSRAAAAARLADLIERHEAVATSIGLGFYPPAYDVVVAGVSLVTNYREEFNTVVRDQGVDALVKQLQAKNK